MKSFFLAFASLLAISTAHAEDAPQGCAPVEGTWHSTYSIDHFGTPERLYWAPTDKPFFVLRIEKERATLTVKGREKKIFMKKKYGDDSHYSFAGIDKNNNEMSITTRYDIVKDYIDRLNKEDMDKYNEMKPCIMYFFLENGMKSPIVNLFEREE